ncbi:hypothetical protein HPMBJEAJ_00036 [Aeromonas phage avDM6]|nr:hypothetical protein HPMBJEAJ_00036 [Aeromonas phage avDM6]
MKLVSQNNVAPTFGVDFHGVRLTVPMKYLHGYLAMDSDMVVYAFQSKPLTVHYYDFKVQYWSSERGDSCAIAIVETDMDWKDTLVSLQDNSVTKYLGN